MIKRTFDIFFSVFFLLITAPLILFLGLLIVMDTRGPMFIFQERIGKNNAPFPLIKLRSMVHQHPSNSLLTIGLRDARITRVGYYLRKFKLDELPQFWNVLVGNMSIVGPRPEVKKYVDLYSNSQLEIFNYRPGITDLASIHFWNESELLSKSDDPEKFYVEEILPKKIQMSLEYSRKSNFWTDLGVILKTFTSIFTR